MNEELKKKWVAALRSGDYKQDKAALRTNNGYCCLGVLCDIIDNTKWEENTSHAYYRYNGCSTYLPDNMSDDIALNKAVQFRLGSMNDENHSFEEIANYIEKGFTH